MANKNANAKVNPEYQLALAGGFQGTEDEFLKIQSGDSADSDTVNSKEESNTDLSASTQVENTDKVSEEEVIEPEENYEFSLEKLEKFKKSLSDLKNLESNSNDLEQDKNSKEIKSYVVVKQFKDSKQYVPNGYVAETYAVGDYVDHFDSDRINSLLERKLIKEV